MFRDLVHFTVNGQFVELQGSNAFAPMSDTLRYHLRKPGTKVVCAEGDCGACTIMLARAQDQELRYRSINSCIFPSFLADGCHIVTIEGLTQMGQLHEVQKSMVENFGGQCGFCTPGFVMSITNMYEHKTSPNQQNIKNYLTGNLCRCTGYQPIISAAKNVDPKKFKSVKELYPLIEETQLLKEKTKSSVLIETENKVFFAPSTLEEATEFKTKYPSLRIFSGATDLGVQINKGFDPGKHMMSFHLMEDFYKITQEGSQVHIGAKVSLDRLQEFLEDKIPAAAEFLNIFASPQIKNSATLVGNLANGSPVADTTPFLLCLDAEKEIVSSQGIRQLKVTEFFKSYKSFNLKEDEFITKIFFNIPDKNSKIGLYKVSQRRDLDISSVNSSFIFKVKSGKVETARIAYGGIAATPVRLKNVEDQLVGKPLDSQFLNQAKTLISSSIKPISDVRGSDEFRKLIDSNL